MSSFLVQSTPDQIKARFASAYNQFAARKANLGKGSSLGAVQNALTALSVDLQQQIAYVRNITRLQSSASTVPGVNSPDVDSFCQQFNVDREPAVAAELPVVFGCNSPAGSNLAISAYDPTTNTGGTYVATSGGVQFLVIADTTQPGYNAALKAYIIPAGQQSVTATVQALVPGSSGNVQAGTITSILSLPGAPAPAGVTSVTNPNSTDNGRDEETDAEYIARFQTIMSGRWATPLAVAAAVEGAQGGLTFQVGDMLDQYGNALPNFFAVIYNALGQNTAPDSTLQSLVRSAVERNRPLGMPFSVSGPALVPVNVGALLTLAPGAVAANVLAAAQIAVANYLNNIGMVNGVITDPTTASIAAQYSETIVILRTIAGVTNVTGVTLNGGTSDISAGYGQQIVAGTIALNTQ